jgi:hypothetical protein
MAKAQAPLRIYLFTCKNPPNLAGSHWVQKTLSHINHVRVSNVKDCDVIVCTEITTNDANLNQTLLHKLLEKRNEKPLVCFFHDDPEQSMDIPSLTETLGQKVLVFRTSVSSCTIQPQERVWPSFQAADENISHFPPVTCDAMRPRIGFCGVCKWPSRRLACIFLTHDQRRFETVFQFRRNHHTQLYDKIDQDENKREFYEIMEQCPYQLCCRGAGNFSHRFYETLASGRIPVLVDTEMCIPHHVPKSVWDQCVVMTREAHHLPNTLFEFHKSHDLEATQKICRQMWEDYFRFDTFARFLEQDMRTLLS